MQQKDRLIEKRVRKYLRINKLIKKGDNILVTDDLSHHYISSIFDRLPIKVYKRKSINRDFIKKNNINRIIIKKTMDDYNHEFLDNIFSNKKLKKQEEISILGVMSDKEAMMAAKFNKIKFEPNKKDKKIKDMLEKLEKDHPNVNFALKKSYDEYKKCYFG